MGDYHKFQLVYTGYELQFPMITRFIFLMLIAASSALSQNRIWSTATYGKADPREFISEAVYSNCTLWMTMNQNPSQFGEWVVPDGSNSRKNGVQTSANSRPAWTNVSRGALVFDGTDDYVTLSNGGITNTSFTFCAWIYPRTYGSHASGLGRVISMRGVTGFYGFDLAINKDLSGLGTKNMYVAVADSIGGSLNYQSNNDCISTNTWQYISLSVANGSNASFYVNGSAKGTSVFSPAVSMRTNDFIVGKLSGNNILYFNGLIDLPVLEARTLSSAEITNLFLQTKGVYGL